MTLEEMVTRIKADTLIDDVPYIIGKLNAAQDWITNRILPMNKECLKKVDDEITLAADTHTYDLAANVATGTLYQLEWLGVKYASDTRFMPVVFVSGSDSNFIYWDQQTVQSAHPVYCCSENFDQVRFAPGLPDGTIIRSDYIYKPRKLDLATNVFPDLPEPFHECQVSDATARCFVGIDDDRALYFKQEALDAHNGAKNVLGIRQFQQAPRTRPSHRSRTSLRT